MNNRVRVAIGAAVVGVAGIGLSGAALAGTSGDGGYTAGHVATSAESDGGEGRTGLVGGVLEGVGGLLGGVWEAAGPVADGLL